MPDRFAVYRLGREDRIPDTVWRSSFVSVSRSADELSVLVEESIGVDCLPAAAVRERGFRALRVAGTLAFELTGVLHQLTAPLADAKLSVFAVSTYDTDYLLVKDEVLAQALAALAAAGFGSSDQPSGD